MQHPGCMNICFNALRAYCRQEGLDDPVTWLIAPDRYLVPDPCIMPYSVAVHLTGNERWEVYDADVQFIFNDLSGRENRLAEEDRLRILLSKQEGRPLLLTRRIPDEPDRQQRNRKFYEGIGFQVMPVRWTDRAGREYEVFMNGHMEMGGFAALMERVEYIGSELVYL